ncbi:hypothetical protein [Neobacillus bataviensis]|uniref:hypothetical protein n=1 Tax=Neobacillus bataviensis TaxID=220685 RepID=UPI001CBBDD67|nr:hypothetical protein [Neobacillus bataviensis]
MLPLPEKFDENEWFLLLCVGLSYLVVFLLPRRFPRSLSVLFLLTGTTIARLSDHLLASPKLDLYNIMDTPNYDLFDLITYFLYAPFSYLFLYFYDKWNIRGYWILLYLVLSTAGGTLFEWINQEFGVFTYKGWQLSYSFSVYLAIQCLVLLFFHWVMRRQPIETADSH